VEDIEFSAGFCHFIKTTVPSVDAAELLLVFHANPEASMTLEEATAKLKLGIEPDESSRCLALFESCGIVVASGDRYRYCTDTPLAEFVETLAQAYSQRPVTLVRIIYALRDSRIQSFADAFKLRRT
jgi:hypothetical protein